MMCLAAVCNIGLRRSLGYVFVALHRRTAQLRHGAFFEGL
jgi:hypothetical protein